MKCCLNVYYLIEIATSNTLYICSRKFKPINSRQCQSAQKIATNYIYNEIKLTNLVVIKNVLEQLQPKLNRMANVFLIARLCFHFLLKIKIELKFMLFQANPPNAIHQYCHRISRNEIYEITSIKWIKSTYAKTF